jgi:hypothetical protein
MKQLIVNAVRLRDEDLFLSSIKSIWDPVLLSEQMRRADVELRNDSVGLVDFFMSIESEEIKGEIRRICLKKDKLPKRRHIMSDIDDTLFPSWFGGTDRPKDVKFRELYPGVQKVMHTLSRNTGYVTLLSARPNMFRKFKKTEQYLADGFGTVTVPILSPLSSLIEGTQNLAADVLRDVSLKVKLKSAADFIGQRAGQPLRYYNMSFNKSLAMQAFHELFPEYNIWFFGDCGQGDLIAALDSIKNKWIERAFMHQINSKSCVFPQGFDDAKARVTEFKDYNELQDKLNDERIEGIKF